MISKATSILLVKYDVSVKDINLIVIMQIDFIFDLNSCKLRNIKNKKYDMPVPFVDPISLMKIDFMLTLKFDQASFQYSCPL